MSEREQTIVEKVSEAIPQMTELDKGYLLGKVEEMAAAKRRQAAAPVADAQCPSSLADGENV